MMSSRTMVRIGLLFWRNVCLAGWLAAGVLLSAQAGPAVQVVDDRGETVVFATTPLRIVSLLPSLTETVCALDLCQRLVGVDRYSDFPAHVRSLPKMGGGLDPSIEGIVALRPDVVLMATSSRVGDRLRTLGIKVLALEPKTHRDVERTFSLLGQVLDAPQAQQVWRELDAGVSAAARTLPPGQRPTRVYFEVGQGPYAASESSFIGQTLTRLGVTNIVPGNLGPFPKLNAEFVVRANPDVVMIGLRGAGDLSQRPGWTGIQALRDKRVCTFTPEQANVMVRAGPRLAEGARLMAQCLQQPGAKSPASSRSAGVPL